MTRLLSELLAAREPAFRLNLRQLEQSNGMPNADIRLTTEVLHGSHRVVRELGLDPNDTTGPELYRAIGARLAADEKRFTDAIQDATGSRPADLAGLVSFAISRELSGRTCFALKNASARRLLKANLPKKTMKQLGYRSADSMLKHESPASIYAAASLIESTQWVKRTLAAYAKITAVDFEVRAIAIDHPSSARWQKLSDAVISGRRHNVLTLKELGSVVILPFPAEKPALPALSSAVLALHAVNDIMAASTFMKLHQVSPKFGAVVQEVVSGEPAVSSRLLDRPVSWSLVQQFCARAGSDFREDIIEPILQTEDLIWYKIEHVLSRIEPGMAFWQDTAHVGLTGGAKAPVSCNLTDNVLSHCNQLPYVSRFAQYLQSQLSQELQLRYMKKETIEQTIAGLMGRDSVAA